MKRLVLVARRGGSVAAAVARRWVAQRPRRACRGRGGARRSRSFPRCPPRSSRASWVIGVKCDFPPFGCIDSGQATAAMTSRSRAGSRRSAFGAAEQGQPHVRDDARAASRRSVGAGRHHHLDAHVDGRPGPTRSTTRSRTTRRPGGCWCRTTRRSSTAADLAGKTVVTTRGAIYATVDAQLLQEHERSSRSTARPRGARGEEGRADAFMFDDAFLLGVATQDSTLKLTNDKFLNVPWGIGIRKGDADDEQVGQRGDPADAGRTSSRRSSSATSPRGSCRASSTTSRARGTRSRTRSARTRRRALP